MIERLCLILMTACMCAAVLPTALAQPVEPVFVQPVLVKGDTPVDGIVTMALRIVSGPAGDTVLFGQTNAVTVVSGTYSTSMGEEGAVANLASAIAASDPFLEMWVDDILVSRTKVPASWANSLGNDAAGELPSKVLVLSDSARSVDMEHPNIGASSIGAAGFANTAGGRYAVVGGGWSNQAPGYVSVIGGGWQNVATGDVATVSGGQYNRAEGAAAAVGGGWNNAATGDAATVPGGRENVAAGDYGLAAGRNANALHPGAFVWSDSSSAAFSSTGPDQFLIRANGNVGIDVADPDEKLTVDGNVHVKGRLHIAGGEPGAGRILVSDDAGWASWQDPAPIPASKGPAASMQRETDIEGDTFSLRVGGASVLRVSASSESPSMVAGHDSNSIPSTSFGSTIGGGGRASHPNLIDGHFGYIGGGMGNRITGAFASIGGGFENIAGERGSTVAGGLRNRATNLDATVSGGRDNEASGAGATASGGQGNRAQGRSAAVAGGAFNAATGPGTAILGGSSNVASGLASAVLGGSRNTAAGDYSVAAGLRARSAHPGSFVWADATDRDLSTTRANQFVSRATGGMRFYTDPGLTAGVELVPGAGSWSSLSDRSAKENVEPAVPGDVLRSLVEVPISTWNYRAQDPSIRHIGPMAQDFSAAFRLSEGTTHITDMDAIGVALTSIQGLYELLEHKAARLEELEMENRELSSRLDAMEKQLDQMREAARGLAAPPP